MKRDRIQADTDGEAPWDALPLVALMGLKALPYALRAQMLATQIEAINRLISLRITLSIVAILCIVTIYWGSAPQWMLGGWALLAAMSDLIPMYSHIRRGVVREPGAMSRALWLHSLECLVQGAVWGAPMLLFAPHAGIFEVSSLWTMSACVMAAVAIGFHATPLAALLFLSVVGGASVAMMWNLGSILLATMVASFTIVLFAACIRQAQIFGRQVVTDCQLADKRETVSLLLREYNDSGADWLWQTDASRRLTGVTPQFARLLGITPGDVEGRSFVEILAGSSWQTGDFHPALQELAARFKAREPFANLVVPILSDGLCRWWELSASPRFDEKGRFQGFRGVGSDVTVEQESTARIAELARTDLLTKLPNRLHLTEALATAVEQAARDRRPCALLMIDLDRFKAVNDTLGHQVGDQLLEQVASRLRAVCGANEMCGRLGGDEFAVLIRDARDAAYVDRVAVTIIDRLSARYEVEHHTLYIGASVGSATAPRDGDTPDTLIRSADLAMYRAKEKGGGEHFAYVPSLHADAEERRKMEIALRGAIENGEFHVVYQPVVDAQSGDLQSFEALLRWTHPEFGSVSPAKFIPLAEEARLIGAIGEWVLRTACHEARKWPGHVSLAVNMSPEQFNDPEIVTKIISALSASGLAPQRLDLEVTESVFMREGNDISKMLEKIMSLGVGLALDDFGTGYSSLGYLSRSRFKTIKIDRSFVVGAARREPECLAIVNAVVALANSLGMATTAEGVETEEQLAIVRELGCTKVQGFYFGRPMPVEDVHRLFADRATRVA